MVRCSIYGILAGYEDQNDHDTLRADPVFKLVADPPTIATWPVMNRRNQQLCESVRRILSGEAMT
jgi:hypothetical protein